MNAVSLPRICISASASGSGKTMFCCALAAALVRRGWSPAMFKCGPDYIDPMFHRAALGGGGARNLDVFMLGKDDVQALFAGSGVWARPAKTDIAVIEGAMGFYDGLGGVSTEASCWELAALTGSPAVLIEDCRSLSVTMAARLKGLLLFREQSGIRAVILNKLNPRRFNAMRRLIEDETGLKTLGFLPQNNAWSIESRHLGLKTALELDTLQKTISDMAGALEDCVDIPALEMIAKDAAALSITAAPVPSALPHLRIGIAWDKAFCFYYEAALALLETLGAELVRFSPLAGKFPENLDGLVLGGGYPELYAQALSENTAMLHDIHAAVLSAMPCIAECGGFMYLHREIIDGEGRHWPMAALIPASCRPAGRLVRFGYASWTAQKDNLLCLAGETLRGHEFHYWESDAAGSDFIAKKPCAEESWPAIHASMSLFAGFPHFHFSETSARRFLNQCLTWRNSKNG